MYSSLASVLGDAGLGKISESWGAIKPELLDCELSSLLSPNRIEGGEVLDGVKVSGVLVEEEVVAEAALQPGGVVAAAQPVSVL
jgi:hypothetical protein